MVRHLVIEGDLVHHLSSIPDGQGTWLQTLRFYDPVEMMRGGFGMRFFDVSEGAVSRIHIWALT
jgi:hypothetical protein